ncbi:uncharacterized protein LOC124447403 [Xenia sp. Carnegie-2017]|uniref:uncharacterized protein LOC124447403 n=1 Tax=Xenia sp. Carnegie-2017 TaxID=2897299 RepID=UPI001F04E574|nr:uncharacterized protein LOC124447403 [Xenia sp. Carnegie-2017]
MSELTRKRQSRSGHKSYATKVVNKVRGMVNDNAPLRKVELEQMRLVLVQKLHTISKLDDEIQSLLEKDDDIAADIDSSSEYGCEVLGALAEINEALSTIETNKRNEELANTSTSTVSSGARCRVKLPKLEVKKFSGKIQDWREFWDSFESSIHNNDGLSEVDKFTYLRGLVEEPAKSAISGFALTSINYAEALKVLERRYGSKVMVQRAHVNDLMNLKPVYNESDTTRLRKFFDAVETNYRGLEALGVKEETYCEIVVPNLLTKIPNSLKLTITRGRDYLEWGMKDFVDALQAEVELRECHKLAVGEKEEDQRRRRREPGTASGLFASRNNRLFCAFCCGEHKHEECTKVTGRQERMQLLPSCSICDKSNNNQKDERNSREESGQVSVANVHVSTRSRVALQTAQGVLIGKGNTRVRVLFDSGSQKSFVTCDAKRCAKLNVARREWLEVNTFGGGSSKGRMTEVVQCEVSAVRGGRKIRVEALVVPHICAIKNEHLEVDKNKYSHLKDLWLSDVNLKQDTLDVDVLIGADNLWAFQQGEIIRGKDDEPVAINTCLGWVISGPLKGSSNLKTARVNLVSQIATQNADSINGDVSKLWDLETLGVRETNDVHEALLDKIEFNGSKYVVKLPWKQGHEHLPSNYSNSLARMKGQIKRLSNEPSLLKEYDNIIKEQLETGVIERVDESEPGVNVHYLPHQAVIRKEAKTTKLRIVYDASSKEGKRGTSLNDCLHVGPPLTPLLFDILIRFRENRVALVGDIEKAFLNVEVDEADRNYLRFLWVRDATNGNLEVVVYRFCRVVFGLNASPFLLNATLRHHIAQFAETDQVLAQKLNEGFYVDDLVSGGKSAQETIELYEKAKFRMSQGGFKLRKWLTNDGNVRALIEQRECGNKVTTTTDSDDETFTQWSLGALNNKDCAKVLGIGWDCDNDLFTFDLRKFVEDLGDKTKLTKRSLLSALAKIFDPLGLISAVIILMKILFQQLCVDKVDWDDKIEAKLVESVGKALEGQVGKLKSRYWLDSITALYWIQNRGEWKQFVRHRVNEILSLTSKESWGHCPGVENPADLGSRGVFASNLEQEWPQSVVSKTEESVQEERKAAVLVVDASEKFGIDQIICIDRYSRVERLFRVTAWVARFVRNLIARTKGKHEDLTFTELGSQELQKAERLWIKASQDRLKKEDKFKQLEVQLNVVEKDGLLKCQGRLAESDLEEETKFPTLLPKEGRLTELIVEHSHRKVHHSGVRATLAEIRSRFWIPQGRQRVKSILNKCIVCKKLEGKSYNRPSEANLPAFRVEQSEPFSKTGVDFAGPLYVKNAPGGTDKVYIALFSCCVTRALHLDLVKDLSADEFVRCLRRFAARRGTPSLMVSDNAKTFKATVKTLENLYKNERMQGYLGNNRIEWKFNLERAPWWGGFFERMVRSVKRCLKKVLGNARLTFDELLTILVEVEATLNSRPLTYTYDEVGSEPLTPSHLVTGRRLLSMPDEVSGEEESDEGYCKKRYQYLSKKKMHFWNRWRKEYLVDLREFHRKDKDNTNRVVQRGDVVTVYEDNVKRGNWKTGVIEELFLGKDGVVRGAKVRLVRNGKVVHLNRPVQKLFPTELKHDEGECEREEREKGLKGRKVENTGRPKRAAALDSVWKTQNMLD